MERSAQSEFKIVIDRLPELTITSPTCIAVATHELLLNATCVDDSEGCTISLKQQSNTLFTWEKEVNELFDFSLYLGKQVFFELQATDSRGQLANEALIVFVDESDVLEINKSFQQQIIDVSQDKVLLHTRKNAIDALSIFDFGAGEFTQVDVPIGTQVDLDSAFITPNGAIFATEFEQVLYEWNEAG